MRKLTDKGRAAPSSILETSRPARHPQGLELDVLAAWVTASPDGVLVLDSDLRVVYASPAYCALFDLQSDRVLGQDLLRFVPEQHRQTALAHWADVRDGRSESIGFRVDGSELELEVRGTVLDLQRNRFLVLSFRDVTERQRQARQAAALAQAASCAAASDSVDAVLEAVSECALAGTRALAAWVMMLDDEDQVAAWVGAAGVPDGFREHLRSEVSEALPCFRFTQTLAAERVVVYADARQLPERAVGTACLLESLPWQPAAFAPLLHQGAGVGLLTAIYRVGEMRTRPRRASWGRWRTKRRRTRQTPSCWQPPDGKSRWRNGSGRPGSCTTRSLTRSTRSRLEHRWHASGSTRILLGSHSRSTTSCGSRIEIKQALHRIGQEALWNTVKHARARRVEVRIETDEDSVLLEIADHGVGFDPNRSFPGHLGLRSMLEGRPGSVARARSSAAAAEAPGWWSEFRRCRRVLPAKSPLRAPSRGTRRAAKRPQHRLRARLADTRKPALKAGFRVLEPWRYAGFSEGRRSPFGPSSHGSRATAEPGHPDRRG